MNGNRMLAVASSSKSLPHASSGRPESLAPGGRGFPRPQDGANMWSPCSNCSSSDENNSPTALNSINWDKPALEDKSVDFGWSPEQISAERRSPHRATERRSKNCLNEKKLSSYDNCQSNGTSTRKSSLKEDCQSRTSVDDVIHQPDSSLSDDSRLRDTLDSSNCIGSDDTCLIQRSEEEIRQEREALKNVAWFQAGIPREIALEVLAEKPEGSFIVRESTTKPGCYALSLRVPTSKNPTGIAHYLILRTNKGYKIKGFTKEFLSLSALITHHSVMPELLPCPLSLQRHSTRDAEHEFEETEQKTCDIFADIHWLMTDLEV